MRVRHVVESAGHEATTIPNLESLSISDQLAQRYSSLIAADALVVLPGWQKHDFARKEVALANELGITVFRISASNELAPRVEIIGVSGYARAGKDTIGEELIQAGYRRASFADYIREALYRLNPWVADGNNLKALVDQHGWEEIKPTHPEVREMLQRLGAEVGRAMLGEDVWVNLTFSNLPDGAKIVVTDCRFPNEAEAIKKMGGKMWRVERDGYEPANAHISETALDDWDFDEVFFNNGSIEELHSQVKRKLNI
jgi:hypothetical protein